MLSKKYRLKKNSDFNYIFRKGVKVPSRFFVLLYTKTKFDCPKFGIIVSKKNGGAVIRNKIKRKLREAIFQNINNFNKNYNYIFIAKQIDNVSVETLSKSINFILEKNNLLV